MLYVHVSGFVVRGCAISRMYIDVCNCDGNVCIVLCVLMVNVMYVVVNVMLSLMSEMSPPHALVLVCVDVMEMSSG